MRVWTRDDTLHLFERQLYSLQSKIIRRISNYVLEVEVKGQQYVAVVVGYSHDYHLDRVERTPYAGQINFVICYRHNSCLDRKVLELCSASGHEYDNYECPSWFHFEKRKGPAWAQVFVGSLLSGYSKSFMLLEQIKKDSPAAYYRYMRRLAKLSAHKQGHPIAV